jgi:hypothetical protein
VQVLLELQACQRCLSRNLRSAQHGASIFLSVSPRIRVHIDSWHRKGTSLNHVHAWTHRRHTDCTPGVHYIWYACKLRCVPVALLESGLTCPSRAGTGAPICPGWVVTPHRLARLFEFTMLHRASIQMEATSVDGSCRHGSVASTADNLSVTVSGHRCQHVGGQRGANRHVYDRDAGSVRRNVAPLAHAHTIQQLAPRKGAVARPGEQ